VKLVYWKGEVPNFGDELNPWLWDKLLPGFLDDDDRDLFLGIGSILWDGLPNNATKVVFGSGYANYWDKPVIDSKWKIYFVRGRRSAKMIGIEPTFALGDPATLVRLAIGHLPQPAKLGSKAFMPHWESAEDGDWEAIAAAAGLTFIDPRWEVERVIQAIRGADLLITEAMHGAIVADALRVRWVPYAPPVTHHAKWYDWAETVDVCFEFMPSTRSSWLEMVTLMFPYNKNVLKKLRAYGRRFRKIGAKALRRHSARSLVRAAQSTGYLSEDRILDELTGAIALQLARLRRDHPSYGATCA
jgi:hypothetical protein